MVFQRGEGHAGQRFGHADQAVFADVGGILAFGQQFGILVFQPGKAAVDTLYADFGVRFLSALGRLLTDIDARRERKAHVLTPKRSTACPA